MRLTIDYVHKYYLLDVCEVGFREFKKDVERCKSYERIYGLHIKFLKRVEEGMFVGRGKVEGLLEVIYVVAMR